jgi:hypothetical protein
MGNRRACRKKRSIKSSSKKRAELRLIKSDPGLLAEYEAHQNHYGESLSWAYPFSWGMDYFHGDEIVWVNRGLVDIAYMQCGEGFYPTGKLRPAQAA